VQICGSAGGALRGNSPILDVEPVFALVLASLLPGQPIAAVQAGRTVVWLGLRRRPAAASSAHRRSAWN
jgi:hypothetical protein